MSKGRTFLVALMIVLFGAYTWVLFASAQAPVYVDDTFDSPLDHGQPGYKMLWEFVEFWGQPNWTLVVRFAISEDVPCSPMPCHYIFIVNEDYSNGKAWESYGCSGSGCLSNYWYYLDAFSAEWGFDYGDPIRADLYWTDQPQPWYLGDLLHLGILTTTVPLYDAVDYPINDFEATWREVGNTIVSTFMITSVDAPTTTLEIRVPNFQWVPEERRPTITNEFPHACSFRYPSGEMSGWGCVDSWFSSDTAPFTAVLTVTAVPPLHVLYMGESHKTTCYVAAFESDGRTHWYLGNLWEQLYCGPVPPSALLPLVMR